MRSLQGKRGARCGSATAVGVGALIVLCVLRRHDLGAAAVAVPPQALGALAALHLAALVARSEAWRLSLAALVGAPPSRVGDPRRQRRRLRRRRARGPRGAAGARRAPAPARAAPAPSPDPVAVADMPILLLEAAGAAAAARRHRRVVGAARRRWRCCSARAWPRAGAPRAAWPC